MEMALSHRGETARPMPVASVGIFRAMAGFACRGGAPHESTGLKRTSMYFIPMA